MTERTTPTTHCRSCGAPIAFIRQPSGKLAPMCVEDGVVTTINHFSNCPDARQWSKPKPTVQHDG